MSVISDICFRLKGRLNSVFQCVPTDEAFGPNTSVLMWNTILCNKKQDCHNHEDELLEKCLPVTGQSVDSVLLVLDDTRALLTACSECATLKPSLYCIVSSLVKRIPLPVSYVYDLVTYSVLWVCKR